MEQTLACFRGDAGAALAKKVFSELQARQIPYSPANYQIWASYHAGADAALVREVDQLVRAGAIFTDEVNAGLFERCFAGAGLTTRTLEVGDALSLAMRGLAQSLQSAGAGTADYAARLDAAAQRFNGPMSGEDVQAVIGDLTQATAMVAERTQIMAATLDASAKEVDGLKRTLAQAQHEARSDPLTGIANRKSFEETLKRGIAEAKEEQTPLCLIVLDIDHFKRVNDTWGHSVGDQVIRFVAQQMSAHAAPRWLAARFGGEEFALIAPRTSLSEATRIAREINAAIKAKELTKRSSGERLGAVTVSAGVAQWRQNETAEALFARADVQLYQAKSKGRDQVCAA